MDVEPLDANQEYDLKIMGDMAMWSYPDCLPMKRWQNGGWQLGYLLSTDPALYVGSASDPPSAQARHRAQIYDSLEAILRDGWEVD